MAYFIGTMIPFVVIGAVIYITVKEHERKRELDEWTRRNYEIAFGKKMGD